MSAASDFKAAFRAAKSARDGGKPLKPPTKEQLRAMKAQKAAALAQQAEEAAADRTRSCEEDTRSMPPPPPRMSAPAKQAQVSYHADSQATRVGEGATGALQSEPSVNNRCARAPQTSPDAVNNATSAVGSTDLPTGFFEASVGEGGGGGAAVLSGGGSARSAEGSTGGLECGRGGSNAADLATSALSPPPKQRSGAATAAASAAVPSGIYEGVEEDAETGDGGSLPDVGSAPAVHAEESAAGPVAAAGSAKAALPSGFFSDAAADAKARGVAPKRKKAAELDKELADFINEVETDAAAAAAAAAAADEDDSAVRRDRDDFEHFVRMERLRELKEAAAKRGTAAGAAADDAAPLASALELAGIQPEAPPPPVLALPKRRKVAEALAQLQGGGDDDGSSGSDGEDMVNWRAKQSTR